MLVVSYISDYYLLILFNGCHPENDTIWLTVNFASARLVAIGSQSAAGAGGLGIIRGKKVDESE